MLAAADDTEQPYLSSHIKGFRSAIANYYDSRKLDPETDNKALKNDALTDYEKLINDLEKRTYEARQRQKRFES